MYTDHSGNVKKLRHHAKAVLRDYSAADLASADTFETMDKILDNIQGMGKTKRLAPRKRLAKNFADEM